MHIKTDGLVIREQNTGESDRLVTILTREHGVLRAFVRGAKNIKSRNLSSTQLLCYSHFTLYRTKDSYIVDNAEAIEVFFDLRKDIENLSLALYLAEVSSELSPQEDNAEEFLRLLLNSLHLLCKSKRNPLLIKSTLELRALSASGYMPDLLACSTCGEFESDIMYFNISSGTLTCSKCGTKESGEKLSNGVISAMRYIIYSDFAKIFDFNLSDDCTKQLSFVSERYLMQQTQRNFKTLDFYYSVYGEHI
ncbi:MAG: DNA repair protein RecO [Oscillospiraceae bacterium]